MNIWMIVLFLLHYQWSDNVLWCFKEEEDSARSRTRTCGWSWNPFLYPGAPLGADREKRSVLSHGFAGTRALCDLSLWACRWASGRGQRSELSCVCVPWERSDDGPRSHYACLSRGGGIMIVFSITLSPSCHTWKRWIVLIIFILHSLFLNRFQPEFPLIILVRCYPIASYLHFYASLLNVDDGFV